MTRRDALMALSAVFASLGYVNAEHKGDWHPMFTMNIPESGPKPGPLPDCNLTTGCVSVDPIPYYDCLMEIRFPKNRVARISVAELADALGAVEE